MTDKKKIGLFVLNWNYRDFLPWALRSVEKQTRQPDVLLFVDDHSDDDSLEIVRKHFSHLKFDEIIAHKKNLGCVKSNNLTVKKLGEDYGCDYVCGLSADDFFDAAYLEKTEKALSSAPPDVGWVYSYVRRVGDENSVDIHPDWDKSIHDRIPFCHGSSLIRYSAWESVGGLPDTKREEDYQMFKNMSELGWKGLLIKEPIMKWRKHRLGCRTTMDDKRRAERWLKKKGSGKALVSGQ
jgi:GT2 family glycosyltransferase